MYLIGNWNCIALIEDKCVKKFLMNILSGLKCDILLFDFNSVMLLK